MSRNKSGGLVKGVHVQIIAPPHNSKRALAANEVYDQTGIVTREGSSANGGWFEIRLDDNKEKAVYYRRGALRRIDDEISTTALAAHQQAARSSRPIASAGHLALQGDKRRGDISIDSADDSSDDHDDDHLILVEADQQLQPRRSATAAPRHGRRAPRSFSSHAAATLTVHVAAEEEEESPGSPSSSVSLDDVGSAGGRTPTGASSASYIASSSSSSSASSSSSSSSVYDKSTRRVQRKPSHPYRSIFLGDQLFSWDFHSVAVRNDAAILGHYNAPDLSASATSPVCASCHSDRSPYWHKEHTNALHLLMCNACGIRYKKYRTHCPGCLYVPRREEQHLAACPRCSGPVSHPRGTSRMAASLVDTAMATELVVTV